MSRHWKNWFGKWYWAFMPTPPSPKYTWTSKQSAFACRFPQWRTHRDTQTSTHKQQSPIFEDLEPSSLVSLIKRLCWRKPTTCRTYLQFLWAENNPGRQSMSSYSLRWRVRRPRARTGPRTVFCVGNWWCESACPGRWCAATTRSLRSNMGWRKQMGTCSFSWADERLSICSHSSSQRDPCACYCHSGVESMTTMSWSCRAADTTFYSCCRQTLAIVLNISVLFVSNDLTKHLFLQPNSKKIESIHWVLWKHVLLKNPQNKKNE